MAEANKYQIGKSDRFRAAFGYLAKSASYLPGVQVANAIAQGTKPTQRRYQPGEIFEQDFTSRTNSFLGKPLFDQVKVGDYTFPLDPLVDFHHAKNIVETEIQGGPEVVELVSTRAVAIRIRGILWNNDNRYPAQQVLDLREVFRINATLPVSSRLFNLNGIDSLYIIDLSFPGLEGFEDTQPFEIEARSAQPFELELIDN